MSMPESLVYQLMQMNSASNPLVSNPGMTPPYAGFNTGLKPIPNIDYGGMEADILSAGRNPSGFGWNMPTVNATIQGLGQAGNLYLGLKQLGLAKDSFKFQKQAYNTNLANQIASYNTQVRDRIAGRNYATEEERRAAEAAAVLPAR